VQTLTGVVRGATHHETVDQPRLLPYEIFAVVELSMVQQWGCCRPAWS